MVPLGTDHERPSALSTSKGFRRDATSVGLRVPIEEPIP